MARLPFALQLYTVRDHMEKDPAATLCLVKSMGYDHIELAGTGGMSAKALKALLEETGLNPVSMHVGYERIAGDLDEVIQELKTLELNFAVVPWLGSQVCPNKAAWLLGIQRMDEAGEQLRNEGIRLCYHNHAHEFEKIDGQTIFDLIFGNSAPENLAIQLDTCWAAVGGADPIALLKQYHGRVPLLHVKDYRPGDPPVLTEVGQGCMDWPAVLRKGRDAGALWNIVEQDDHFATDSLDSARAAAEFLAALDV